MFEPQEIIFAATNECNLHCPHCYVNRTKQTINLLEAKTFILSCKSDPKCKIDRIGFSGGEPFLNFDFLLQLIPFCIEQDLMFDQIMTNGVWWKDEEELINTLQALYDAGYDGKLGVSWDSFHAQKKEQMITFITQTLKIFGPYSVTVQTVHNENKTAYETELKEEIEKLKAEYDTDIPLYILPQTYPSDNSKAWQSKKWFKEDYCQGPGNIFYIHPDGNIAPCCGFANENPELFIGTIDDSYETIMQNAEKNKLVQICFNKGLSKYKKQLKKELRKQGKKYPGKCGDICSFCDFAAKNK